MNVWLIKKDAPFSLVTKVREKGRQGIGKEIFGGRPNL